MQTKLPKPEFLTFSELTGRWGYSAAYLHDLIRSGRIIPAIALTDQERYVGGEFNGGYGVGDIENATHKSYSEYYVGTVTEEDNHPEKWPQCSRTVYCHSPVDDGDGYSFQFVSESSEPGDTEQWFYLDRGSRIGSVDAARRFRFVWAEIGRFEAENATYGEQAEGTSSAASERSLGEPSVSQPSVEKGAIRRTLKRRNHVLDAEIEGAKKNALKPEDANSVWAELVKLAEAKKGCLVGVGDGDVKYERDGEIKFYQKKSLAERLRRAKAR